MKLIIHLPPQDSYAPPVITRGKITFERSAAHGGLHVLEGREMDAEEFNRRVESILRPKFDYPWKLKPLVKVLDADPPAPAPADSESGPGYEEMSPEQEDMILAAAETILQKRKGAPVPEDSTSDPAAETPSAPPVKKGGRPRKDK